MTQPAADARVRSLRGVLSRIPNGDPPGPASPDAAALAGVRRARRAWLFLALAALSAALWGAAVLPHQMLLGRDTLGLYLPLKQFMGQAFRAGTLPTWYPYDGLGFSIPGALVAGLLDPSNLLLLILSPASAVKWSVLLCYPVAALGGYDLGRSLRMPTLAACVVGVAFAASGYLLSQSGNLLYVAAAARLPWALGAAERIARCARARDAGVFGIATASILWAGDVEILIPLVAVSAMIVLLRARNRRTAWLRWGQGGLLALLLNAPVLVPAIATYAGSTRAAALSAGEALSWSLHPLRLPELLIGSAFHLDLGLGAAPLNFGGQNVAFWSESVFLGAATCVLAVLGLRARRSGLGLYAALGAIGLWLALGASGHLYARVPGLMHFRYPEKLVVWVSLAVAVAAGAGMAEASRHRLIGKPLLLLAALPVLGAFFGLWLPAYRLRGLEAAAAAVLLVLASDAPLRLRHRHMLMLAVLTFELVLANSSLIHHGDSRQYPLLPPPIPGLRADDRLCADLPLGDFVRADGTVDAEGYTRWQLHAANLDASGIYRLRSTVALVPTLPRELDRLCSVESICADACARVLGARWRVLPPDAAKRLVAGGEFREAARWGEPSLVALEDLKSPGYASLLPARSYRDPWPLEIALHDRKVTPQDFAFVEDGVLGDPTNYGGRGEVTVESSAAGKLEMRTRSRSPAVLSVREARAPGWRATLDGLPVPVLPVNLGMLGLAVPGGEHAVKLEYIPLTWPWAWVPFVLAWAAALALVVRGNKKPRAVRETRTGPGRDEPQSD